MLVKLAGFLPVGELAFRVNLLSAGCAALAVLWMVKLVIRAAGDDVAAVIGGAAAGLALAGSLTFFRQATVAEVYAPNAALVAGALLLYQRVAGGDGGRAGLALAVACGLGLALHSTFALIGLPVAILLVVRLYRGAGWTLITPAVTAAVAGALYLYLPVRAAAEPHPSVVWTRADDSGALLDHVTAAGIRDAYADEMRATVGEVWHANAAAFFGEAAEQLVFVLLAAVAGAVVLLARRRGRWIGGALIWLAAGDAVYSFWLNPMGQVDLQNGIIFALACSALAGVGLALFARLFGRAAPFGGAAAAVLMVVPPVLVSQSQDVWAASRGDLARAWGEAGLAQTPVRGVALAENDSTAATMIYLYSIEQARPDAVVMARQRALRDRWRLVALMERTAAGVDRDDVPYGGRPVAVEVGSLPPLAGFRTAIGIPLARAYGPGEAGAEPGDVAAAAVRLRRLMRGRAADDRAARVTFGHALNVLGRTAFARRQLELAETLYAAAVAVAPTYARAHVNRGAVAAARGDVDAAIAHTEIALDLEPNQRVGLINISRYYISAGRDADARRAVDRLRAIAPDDASGLALAGLLDARAGRIDRARELAQRALAIDADNLDARSLASQLGLSP
jgi:tetratricopeptide (TPR) repeat protein